MCHLDQLHESRCIIIWPALYIFYNAEDDYETVLCLFDINNYSFVYSLCVISRKQYFEINIVIFHFHFKCI